MDLSGFPSSAIASRRDATVRLAARWHGVSMHLPAGQVLAYRGHLPQGVHVVLAGALDVRADDRAPPLGRLDAALGPLVLPLPSQLDSPADATLSIVEDADVLFFPRHVVLAEGELARGLEQVAGAARPEPD